MIKRRSNCDRDLTVVFSVMTCQNLIFDTQLNIIKRVMMFLPVAEFNSLVEADKILNFSQQTSEDNHFYLTAAIIEGFVDGILILTEQGELVYANNQARRLCFSLIQGAVQPNAVAQEIWRVCECLSESYELFPKQSIIIESEVEADSLDTYRIRARWLDLSDNHKMFLFVTLENRHQANASKALTEIKKYKLTRREAEVWLLRQANYSYQEIADKLYITKNTVKKHIKNIHAKQEAVTVEDGDFFKFNLITG